MRNKTIIGIITMLTVFIGLLIYWYDPTVQPGVVDLPPVSPVGVETIFYINKEDAPAKSCGSEDCPDIGYFALNHEVVYKRPAGLANEPEWIKIDFEDGITGYVNKSYLSDKPIK
jgi:hypothetical protein